MRMSFVFFRCVFFVRQWFYVQIRCIDRICIVPLSSSEIKRNVRSNSEVVGAASEKPDSGPENTSVVDNETGETSEMPENQ
jgi:hypothetical protein